MKKKDIIPSVPDKLASPKYLLVTAMKNEGPYLIEWIAHHMAIGVDHFIVVTNHCSDGTNEMLERFQQMGLVTMVINPNVIARDSNNHQWQRRAHAIAQHYPVYKRAEWILHIDVDEFIQVKAGAGHLDDLIAAMAPVDVISMTSVPFNSNGLNVLHDLPVVSQFLQAERYIDGSRKAYRYTGEEKNADSAVKPLFRNAVPFGIRGNHRPFHPTFSRSGHVWKDGSGHKVPDEFTDGRGKTMVTAETVDLVQLNHYAIRSVEASMLKFDRGDVMGNDRLDKSEHYFKNYDNPGEDQPQYATPAPRAAKLAKAFHADSILGPLHRQAFDQHKVRFRELIRDGHAYALARSLGYFDPDRRDAFLKESAAQRPRSDKPIAAQAKLPGPPNPRFELPEIASLWVGPPLTFVEHLVIRSFLDAGHKFTLYSTDKLTGLPDGVTLADPRDLYQAPFETGSDMRHNNAVYADIFRLHMIRDTGAIWADMDAYCLRPFIFPSGYAVGLEEPRTGQFSAANGVLGFPKDSQTLAQSLDLVTQDCPIPPFFNGGRRTRLRLRREQGDSFGFQDFQWGSSGPRLIDFYLRLTDEIRYAVPKDVFYPGPRAFRRPLLNPGYPVETFERPETVSVHIFGKTKAFLRDDFGGDLPEGCYLDILCKRHGIDPKAHPV